MAETATKPIVQPAIDARPDCSDSEELSLDSSESAAFVATGCGVGSFMIGLLKSSGADLCDWDVSPSLILREVSLKTQSPIFVSDCRVDHPTITLERHRS